MFHVSLARLTEEDQIQCEDVTDTGAAPSGHAELDEDDTRSVTELAVMLKKDFSMIHTLSRDEIQVTARRW